ncbi:MAG: peptidoglycan DD-metalloendopeptidase family protein [Lamprobacter sp.]|uniref:murein hydrolase activator EnvC family protein n=1 Tax=Lamprobacter sp. TaxID=3100796 RepID=UPI002B258368|nr:peptidoglycan DD-metalloendopeptidase family protein [Lamprobacter sp.]MEA3638363.1 peptidoglycan DD-metalloendopeptidase family protein [Lamprobacter sp.]
MFRLRCWLDAGLGLGWALVVAVTIPTAVADSEPDLVRQHEAELAQLQARLAQLREGITDHLDYRDALLEELQQFEQDIDALSKSKHQLGLMVANQQEALAATTGQLQAKRAELQAARAELADFVRAAYAMGRGDEVRLLLGQTDQADQTDPGRAERILGYYQVLGARRAARVEQIRKLVAALQQLEQQEREETTRLARLATKQDQTRERLEAALQARQHILGALEQSIADDQRQAKVLEADAAAMTALIERLKREAEIADEVDLSQDAISDLRGQLAWPLEGARLLRGFGEGRQQGALHADGVLLAATGGAEVRAVHHGRVAYADWLRGFGMLIVIDHGEGYLSLYGHCQALLKEVGEWVAAGDLIALAGNSGGLDTKGLYFAIRHQGRAIDPARWCQASRE